MRYAKVLAVALLLAAAVFTQVASPEAKGQRQDQTPRVQGVSVLITATDSKGMPLHDLTKSQVSVSDGNQPAETLTVLDASDLPLDLGIILLASKDKYSQEQAAAIDLAQKNPASRQRQGLCGFRGGRQCLDERKHCLVDGHFRGCELHSRSG